MFLLPGCFTNVYLTKVCYAEKEVNVCWCLLVAFKSSTAFNLSIPWLIQRERWWWSQLTSQIARGKTKTRRTRSSGWSREERLATYGRKSSEPFRTSILNFKPQKAQFRRCWFAADHSHLATWSGRRKRTKTRRKGSVIREYLSSTWVSFS